MKRIIAFILVALFLISAIAAAIVTTTRGIDLKDGDILYECDFSDGLPEDFRIVTSDKSRVTVKDGFLYLDAQGVEFVRVLLPSFLDEYGNYEITIHATIVNQRDGARWGSITYRTQNENYPYYQMCIRHDMTLSNGIEFAHRNTSNAWDPVTDTASYERNMSGDRLDEFKAYVRDDHIIHSVNGTPMVERYEVTTYNKGGVGLQANYCIFKIDDVKVTYLSPAGAAAVKPGAVAIAQPDLNVIGGYALSEYVTDQQSLDRAVNAEIKPANVIFYVDKDLKLTDAEGKNGFSDLKTALPALGGVIMPTVYIRDTAAVNAVCGYLSDNSYTDVFVMSDSGETVAAARKAFTMCRGILDLTKELDGKVLTNEQLLEIRGRANAASASIVVLPDTAADQQKVKYIYDRLVAVWVASTKPVTTVTQAYGILSCGGYGAITDNTQLMYKTATEYMGENKLFRTPLNIGHRGIPSQAPENTVEGCKLAYELGADVVENDVYLTKDGHVVIMHDGTSGRTCNKDLNIEKSTLAELRELYVNKQFPGKEGFTECRIPTLEEYYEEFKGKDIQIFVELKSTTEELVKKFTEITKAYGMEGQVSVITFHANQIKNLHKYFPEMSAGYLCSPLVSGDTGEKQAMSVLKTVQKLSSTYNPSYAGHTQEFAYNANMRGLLTWPWTIDSKADFMDLVVWGYNGLTTNNCTIAAKYPKLLSSEQYAYTLEEGETLAVKATMTTYNRATTDVSGSVRVIPLDGAVTVGANNVLSFDGPGEFTYALEYSYKTGKLKYTIYTQPVTVTVNAKAAETEPPTEQPTEAVTEETPVSTDGPEEPAKSGVPLGVIIPVCAAAVTAIAAVAVLIVKKKK